MLKYFTLSASGRRSGEGLEGRPADEQQRLLEPEPQPQRHQPARQPPERHSPGASAAAIIARLAAAGEAPPGASAGEQLEAALARQTGVAVADVARLLGVSPAAASGGGAAAAAAAAGQDACISGGRDSPAPAPGQQRPSAGAAAAAAAAQPQPPQGAGGGGVLAAERARARHSQISPAKLRFSYLGSTRKTHTWLNDCKEEAWRIERAERQLLPLAAAQRARRRGARPS
jgi:hypothetical protein